jgi:hypothetical protein
MYVRPGVRRLVLDPEVAPPDPSLDAAVRAGLRRVPLTEHFPEMRSDTAADFEVPFEASRLPTDLVATVPVQWLDKAGWKALTARSPRISEDSLDVQWEAFHREFPDSAGWISFSRVGLSNDAGQAVVSVSSTRGSLDGSGHLVFLRKEAGVWRIKKTIMTWVA